MTENILRSCLRGTTKKKNFSSLFSSLNQYLLSLPSTPLGPVLHLPRACGRQVGVCDRVVDVGAFAEDGTAFRAWCVSATTRLSELWQQGRAAAGL